MDVPSLTSCARAFATLGSLALAACSTHAALRDDPARAAETPIGVASVASTQPVPVNEVDDAAIWIHPSDATKSLLFVGNELKGLEIHGLDGLLRKHVDPGVRVNHVDIAYDVAWSGARADIVFASCLAPDARGVRAWRIDPAMGKIASVTGEQSVSVLEGRRLLGLCTFQSRADGRTYVFVTSGEGAIEQHEVVVDAERVTLKLARTLALPSKTEGCVADAELGVVYFAEEDVGIWRFEAEPDASSRGELVARVGEHGLCADVEGLALYAASGGRGYLIAVGQGAKGGTSTLSFYERAPGNAFVALVQPLDEFGAPIDRASGVAVTNRPTIERFPRGVLVVGDHTNPNASEDFEILPWDDVANAAGLVIDTAPSPRAR